jgi:hypothetical protein
MSFAASRRSIRFGSNRPPLAFRERLPQVRIVRERLHHPHVAFGFELLLERVEIELTFEVMHARLKERLSV